MAKLEEGQDVCITVMGLNTGHLTVFQYLIMSLRWS